ncbi:MAG TPA: twin-arginine translocase subunit TatC [Nitrososphaeraceae archaeon]
MIKISEDKPFVKLLYELRVRVTRICVIMIIFISVCMTLGVTIVKLDGYSLFVLYPDTFNSLSIQVISHIKNDLLSNNISLVQTTPGQAFTAQMYVAIIIGIVGSLPVMLGELFAFLNPVLHYSEKRIIKSIVVPTISLFVMGCLFSYYVAIPYTLEFLYQYGQAMNILSFFEITSFILFVVNMLLIFGFSFQLPIVMWALTKGLIVNTNFWKDNLRYVIIFLVILGAIITPDGSGITMWFVVGPLMLLYVIGIIAIQVDLRISKYDWNKFRPLKTG